METNEWKEFFAKHGGLRFTLKENVAGLPLLRHTLTIEELYQIFASRFAYETAIPIRSVKEKQHTGD